MERTYSSLIKIPQFIKELMNKNQLDTWCKSALDAARLEEPVKTGNLRRSTNYSIHEDYIEFYINPAFFFKTGPYYEYLDENNKSYAFPLTSFAEHSNHYANKW